MLSGSGVENINDGCWLFISRQLNKDKTVPTSDDWWPTDYTSALTADDWEVLLNDAEIFTDSILEIMKRLIMVGKRHVHGLP